MSQKIVTLCDIHQQRDEEVPGRPFDVVARVDGGGFRFVTIDLCESCAKPLVDMVDGFAELGREYTGAVPRPPKRRSRATSVARASRPDAGTRGPLPVEYPIEETDDGRVVCPTCGTTAANKSSLRSHLRNRHGQTMSAAYGREDDAAFVCPVCADRFDGATGLSSHIRATGHRTPPRPAGDA